MHRYSVAGHGAMLRDAVRVDAYARAIAESVRPGDVVVELGTGTGLFAMLACRAGAKTVYAVEADDVIELARENVAANDLSGRVVFVPALSTSIELPEPADVVISDVRGVLPPFERGLEAVIDARKRFLKPGGRLIPASDRLVVAAIEAPELHAKLTAPWSGEFHGVRLPAGRPRVLSSWRREDFAAAHLVTTAASFATLDYAALDSPDVGGGVRVVAQRDATAHGLGVWFETTLAPGVQFSTSPAAAAPASVYGQAFFPWPAPLGLAVGEPVDVALHAALVAGDYVWRWETAAGGHRWRQSTLEAEPLSPQRLRRRSDDYVPQLGDEARIDLAVLESIRAGRSLGDIARALAASEPGRFRRWEEALAHVGEVCERYSRSA